VLLRGKIAAREVPGYMAAQVAGAALAAFLTLVLMGSMLVPAPGPAATPMQILLVEVAFTFALCLVVLNVATSPRTEGNSYYGLAIGFTVVVGAAAGGGISGGAFNPAVGLGPALASALTGGGLSGAVVYYLVGPFAGGVLAAGVYRLQEPEAFAPPAAPVAVPFPAGLVRSEDATRQPTPRG
jgi:aquaporin Z